ncbi:MAG: sigma-54 dependent transcriptional regulator [Crocinitomicaceae bacterium]|nr:sigma-54 dependent transcriptional regulator [Crocinitomicaceae bacterium]
MNSNKHFKIYVVDDDRFFSGIIKNELERLDDVEVLTFYSETDFLNSLNENPDLVIIDYDLPNSNGIELLEEVRKGNSEMVCIILSEQNQTPLVLDAYKKKADRYIFKNENALIELVQNVRCFQEKNKLNKELYTLKNQLINNYKYECIIGESQVMKDMLNLMPRFEDIVIPVLLNGENGTGKELLAKTLHYTSNRSKRPFVSVNILGVPDHLIENELFGTDKGTYPNVKRSSGKLEEANGGTIFLDEIGAIPLRLQAKLLQILQENTFMRLGGSNQIKLNVKIVLATSRDLHREMHAGRFREDLYMRLQDFIIELPPLKVRGNDIVLLAQNFVRSFCEKHQLQYKSFGKDAIQSMMEYHWPGNVRELKYMVERAILVCDTDEIKSENLIFLTSRVA